MNKLLLQWCTVVLLLIGAGVTSYGQSYSWPTTKLEKVDLREIPLISAARFLSDTTGITVLPSRKLNNEVISIYLQDTTLHDAVESICRTNGFYPRFDQEANAVYIETSKERSRALNLFSDETHSIVQLLYPRAVDVAEAVQSLYSNRVVWMEPEDSGDKTEDIEKALERMDLMDERQEFDEVSGGSGGSGGSNRNSYDRDNRSDRNNRYDNSSRRYNQDSFNQPNRQKSGLDGLQELLENDEGGILSRLLDSDSDDYSLVQLTRRPEKIYLAAMEQSNMLLIRSADAKAVRMVEGIIKKLDKPVPQVLLEAKVLEVNIDDMNKQGIDWIFSSGNNSGGFASGDIAATNLVDRLAGTASGVDSRSFVFNHISDSFKARIRLLETQERITKLATPTLLVADNEASKVFVGTNAKYLESVERGTSVTAADGVIAEGSGELTPVLGDRNVGTSLLITPKIHADNTVTLRIMQEYSDFGDERDIDYGGNDPVTVQDFTQQVVTTTVVAGSGNMLVVGGLIREGLYDDVEGIPYMMNLPYLGNLFKRTERSRKRTELLLVIRPYILLAPGDDTDLFGDYITKISQHPSATRDMPALNVTDPVDIPRPVTKSRLKSDAWYKELTNTLEPWSVEHQ